VSLLIIVYLVLCFTLFDPILQAKLKEDWPGNRCKVQFLPVAGLCELAEGSNYFQRTWNNISYCTTAAASHVVDAHTAPSLGIIQGISNAASEAATAVNGLRNMTASMRSMFETLVGGIYDRIASVHDRMTLSMERMKILIKKQSAVMEIVVQFLSTLPFTFSSFTEGPIPRFANWMQKYMKALISFIVICLLCAFGGPFTAMVACPVCALCFAPSTLVSTTEGPMPMANVELGTVLIDAMEAVPLYSGSTENRVLGIIRIYRPPADAYRVPVGPNNQPVVITGCHLVRDERLPNLYVRAKTLPGAIPFATPDEYVTTIPRGPRGEYMTCLWTAYNYIPSACGARFADYRECGDPHIYATIECAIVRFLNTGKRSTCADLNDLFCHLDELPESHVRIRNARTMSGIVAASEQDAMALWDAPADTLYATAESLVQDVGMLYRYQGLVMTGNMLVKDPKDGFWQRVHERPDAEMVVPLETTESQQVRVYHVFSLTQGNTLRLKHGTDPRVLFSDATETQDQDMLAAIDDFLEECLS
jgi:hypothetical protein